jgi:hypothetical protein
MVRQLTTKLLQKCAKNVLRNGPRHKGFCLGNIKSTIAMWGMDCSECDENGQNCRHIFLFCNGKKIRWHVL